MSKNFEDFERVRHKVLTAVGEALKDDPAITANNINILIGGICGGLSYVIASFSTPGSVMHNLIVVMEGLMVFAEENYDELEQVALDAEIKH